MTLRRSFCLLLLLLTLLGLPACLTSDKAFAHLTSLYERSEDGAVKYRSEVPSQSGFRRMFCSADDPPMKSVGDPISFCLENLDVLAERRYETLAAALPTASLLLGMGLDDPVPAVRTRALGLLVDLLKPFQLTYTLAPGTAYDADQGAAYFTAIADASTALRAGQPVDGAMRERDERAARALGALRPRLSGLARKLVAFLVAEMAWREDPAWRSVYASAAEDQLRHAAYLAGQQALANPSMDLRIAGVRMLLMLDTKNAAPAAVAAILMPQTGEPPSNLTRVALLRALAEFFVPLEWIGVAGAQGLLYETASIDGAVRYHVRELFAEWLKIPASAPVEEVRASLTAFFDSRRGLEATSPGGP